MRRRHKITLRPQARRDRNRRFLIGISAIAVIGSLSYAVRRLPRDAFRPSTWLARLPAPDFLRVERVSVSGAPAAVESDLDGFLSGLEGKAWAPWAPGGAERALVDRFPYLETAEADRDWSAKTVAVTVMLRTPIARVTRGGSEAGWLAEDGLLYDAPAGAYPPLELPRVELGDMTAPSLPALGEFVKAAGTELPARLARVAFRSPEEGWNVTVADGTTLLWGGLDWTREKLSRLKQVLGDAGPRFGAGLTADLRYFEDGKILVRPAAASAALKGSPGLAGPGARTR